MADKKVEPQPKPQQDESPKKMSKEDYDKYRAEYKSEIFEKNELCDECIDI